MFTPHSLSVALIMMITSAICWGSWANTYKGVKNYRFELFYWDYAVGIFLISIIFALTMGSTTNDASGFLNNIRSADPANIGYTMVGGAIFNLANLLLVAAIDMAGLAIQNYCDHGTDNSGREQTCISPGLKRVAGNDSNNQGDAD